MNINQSLARGLRILEAIAAHGPEMGVRELARLLELDKSIVSRLVVTLAEHGFLQKNMATRRYRVGPRAHEVGQKYAASNPLYEIANDDLHSLAEQEGLNVYLSVRSDTSVLYLCAIQSAQPSVLRIGTGVTGKLHTTAVGKVLLAAMDDDALKKLLKRLPLSRLTPHSITKESALLAELKMVRKNGYSQSDEENLVGILSIGAPIRDASGTIVAAVSTAVNKQGHDKKFFKRMVQLTEHVAGSISTKLGAPPASPFAYLDERKKRAAA